MPILDYFRRQETCRLLAGDESALKARFERFRNFLRANRDSLADMATLEQCYHSGAPVGTPWVRAMTASLQKRVSEMASNLNALGRGRFEILESRVNDIMTIPGQAEPRPRPAEAVTRPLGTLLADDIAAVGAKAANLGIMGSRLGLRIPDGFAISRAGFERFVEANGLREALDDQLAQWNADDPAGNERLCANMRELVQNAPVPEDLAREIISAYEDLESRTRPGARVAMRSSAVGEDTAASFAGQYVSELNVIRSGLLDAYKTVLASKYAARAIAYRLRLGLDDEDVPMCVLCIEMIDSRESGVLYSIDPDAPESGLMRLAAVAGLGELLVSGQVSPATVLIDRQTLDPVRLEPGSGKVRLANIATGGTELVVSAEDSAFLPAEEDMRELAEAGLRIEVHFGGPQDIEWARDAQGRLFLLQARPLGIEDAGPERAELPNLDDCTVLLDGGTQASRGIGQGPVHLATSGAEIPQGAILVSRSASPDLATFMERVSGIVAESGSVASHLASVARECGVPMIVGCAGALEKLRPGQIVTLVAEHGAVIDGAPESLREFARHKPARIFDTPVARRFRSILDRVSPLHLTDPAAENFSIEGCRTLHDVIRFAHEQVMRVMFNMAGTAADDTPTIRLEFNIPLRIHFIDLGDGLRFGLTDCQTLRPEDIRSVPMRAFWRGLAHPGISWSGGVGLSLGNISSVVMGGMMASASSVGGDSFALVAHDYMNLSAKFGYHFANIDAMCTDEAEQNHVIVQFSGGVGSFTGKSLRLNFLGTVMTRLGYQVGIIGDQLEARASGLNAEQIAHILDQTGRLLAASRLLDVGISGQNMVERLTESFFAENYDFLGVTDHEALPGFYVPLGEWTKSEEDGHPVIVQDGSGWAGKLGVATTRFISRLARKNYQDFLDGFEAYFHFPMVIAKQSGMSDGTMSVFVKPVSGAIDAAAGLAFGVQNVGNYYVWRINALEQNAILFQFRNNERFKLAEVTCPVELGRWVELRVEVQGATITATVVNKARVEFSAPGPVEGHLGLWTKADSKSMFKDLDAVSGNGRKRFC